jgi:hypothetical protein
MRLPSAVLACVAMPVPAESPVRSPSSAAAGSVVSGGTSGPGQGRQNVVLAGDHEYRSEERLPALARVPARRDGVTATVVFTSDPATGTILPGSSPVSGLDALDPAEPPIVSLRFQDVSDARMRNVDAQSARRGPVVGLRTATHAFRIQRPHAPFLKHSRKGSPAYLGGFGRPLLGETRVSHAGRGHRERSRLLLDGHVPGLRRAELPGWDGPIPPRGRQ